MTRGPALLPALLVLAAAAAGVAGCDDVARDGPPPARDELVFGCRAVDGDTLACGEGRPRVRLTGVDTPEMHGRCDAERALARAARERLAGLVAEGLALRAVGEDRFGRELARATAADGRDVAALLVREGLGRAYDGKGPRRPWCAPGET